MASIREVAKLAHVAPSTVSRALNGSGYVSEKSKNKIKKAVEELDYIPNQWIRNLYKKRTGIIGVMTPDIIHPYFSTLWNYLEAELDQYGYNVVICNTRYPEIPEAIREKKVMDDDTEQALIKAIEECKKQFR